MATVKFYPSKPKRNGQFKKNEVPIVAKVTVSKKQRFEVSTGERVIPGRWDFDAQEVKRSLEQPRINKNLAELKAHLLHLCELHRDNFEELKAIAQGGEPAIPAEEKKSLSHALDRFLKQYEQQKDPKTAAAYSTLQTKHLAAYLKYPFEKLDWDFFDALRHDLREHKDSTANKILGRLKKFLSWCEERDLPVNPVFRKWKIAAHYGEPVALDWDEVVKLERTMMVGTVAIARDALLILCMMGTRISDGKRFDVTEYFDYVWKFYRQKGRNITAKQLEVQFVGYSEKALMILAKYGMMFPCLSEAKLNKHMKEACRLAGINQKVRRENWVNGKCTAEYVEKWTIVGTHTGRRTFGTLMQEVMPESKVMELMGIEDSKTLRRYKGKGNSQLTKQYLIEAGDKLKAATVKSDEQQREAV